MQKVFGVEKRGIEDLEVKVGDVDGAESANRQQRRERVVFRENADVKRGQRFSLFE